MIEHVVVDSPVGAERPDVTCPQRLRVLRVLSCVTPLSAYHLGVALSIQRSAASMLVRRMHADGLIQAEVFARVRRTGPTPRHYTLTEDGKLYLYLHHPES